ncbi:MAG: hypothetical protein HKN91_07265 [Acidimicrobiia bacterium]|nr:hypothetical protein [Acidimicrobiia bacterium]
MANRVVVRYKTKPESADANHALVAAVFEELAAVDPGGVRYATLRLADNTFIHIADIEADPNPLGSIAAFGEFQREIGARCEPGHAPLVQPAELVGEYHTFEEGFGSV